MKRFASGLLALAVTLACGNITRAETPTEPAGDPVVEPSTLKCLAFHWIIKGDADKKSRVDVTYRKAGTQDWKAGPPLFRVERGTMKDSAGKATFPIGGSLAIPDGWVFAGSIVDLPEATDFEVKLTLVADGGNVEKLLKASTIAEPKDPVGGPVYHVVPATDKAGGGTGTQADPFKGLDAAQAVAKPGDTFLLHAGKYLGAWTISKNGEEGKPIVWKGAGDGEAIIDGLITGDMKPPRTVDDFSDEFKNDYGPEMRINWLTPRAIDAGGAHDVWFEDLSARNAQYALVAHDSARIVIRRCHFYQIASGPTATRNDKGTMRGLFISDNIVEGPATWPRSKGIEDSCGIWITGEQNVVCYNYVHNFADGIQTMRGKILQDIDVYGNDVRQCTDDGLEEKDTFRNIRVFDNRITNVFHPVSVAPVNGGPEYIYRNAIYNMESEPFKIHNSPSGVLFYNNTIVEGVNTVAVWTPAPVHNCVMRNNLFVSDHGNYVISSDAKMIDCDFDFSGFGQNAFEMFSKWNGLRFKTLAEAQGKGLFRHSMVFKPEGMFAAKVEIPNDFKVQYPVPPDLRLAPKSPAVGLGTVLPGFTEQGKPVDLGAYPVGCELPQYGPRPGKK